MADYRAIAGIGETILGVLEAAYPRPDFPEGVDFALFQTSNFQTADNAARVSLYLYRVQINTTRRNLSSRIEADGRRFRPSLPLDLYYLLSAWGPSASKQHQILGMAMRILHDNPILGASLLNRFSPGTFRPGESVELICENLSLQDMANIAEVMKPNLQLSVSYVARQVLIESEIGLEQGEPVQVREFVLEKGVE
ncbi:MAG TPA: DUF4255 domain-containing protein [Chloroflexia bacterium]|nr:DUF4255 domain-containing protein [Chloroflexia bacterium]